MNKILISIIIVFNCCFNFAKAQSNDTIFYEHFENNNNKWPVMDTSVVTSFIENNRYTIEYKGESNYVFWNWMNIDYNKNFYVEIDTKWIGGVNNNGYGLIIGYKNWDNFLEFNISANGYYFIRHRFQGVDAGINWKQSGIINDSSDNKLKIVKYDKYLAFYINNCFVEKMPYENLYMKNFGLMIYNKQKISYGDIFIKYINQTDMKLIFGEDEANRLTALENNITQINNKNQTPINTYKNTIIFKENFSNNNNLWYTENKKDTVIRIIKDSAYIFNNLIESRMNIYQTVYLLRNYDYTIECTTKWLKGVTDFAYGIMWGSKDMDNYNEFVIAADGSYRLSAYSNDNSTSGDWTKDSIINKKGTNIFTVKKNSDSLYLYINHKLIATYMDIILLGNGIGFIVDNKQTIAFDDLIVTQDLPVYNYIAKQTIMSNNFESSAEEWDISENESGVTYINKGAYVFSHLDTTNGHIHFREVYINDKNDFTITTNIKYLKKEKNKSYSFLWGQRDWNNNYQIVILESGLFKCVNSTNSISLTTGWKICENLKPDDYNKITVARVGDRVEYFINDSLVEVMPFYKLHGTVMGYVLYGKQTIAIDDITIVEKVPFRPMFDKGNIITEYHFDDNTKYEDWNFKGKRKDGCEVEKNSDKGQYIISIKGTNEKDKTFVEQISIIDALPVEKTMSKDGKTSEYNNYRIEFCMNFKEGSEESAAGVFFEDKSFMIRFNGSYNINSSNEWKTTNFTKSSIFFYIVIEKLNNNFYFYINNELLEKVYSPSILTNVKNERTVNFGISTTGEKLQKVAFDDIIIRKY